jgi:hypothetical protein
VHPIDRELLSKLEHRGFAGLGLLAQHLHTDP